MKLPIPTFTFKSRHRQLGAMVKENTSRLVAAMGFMLIMAGTTSATAYLVKPVLDDIFFKQDVRMLKLMPLVVILLYLFRSAAYFGHEYLMNYVGEGIIRRLRDLLYSRIHDLPLSFFQSEKTGGLMSRITNDVNVIKAMVSSAVTGSLRDCFSIVGLTFVIFYQDWQLAVIALLVLPVAYYPVVAFGRRVRRVSTGCQECMAELNSFLHETFAGSKIVKAFGMEEYEKRRFFNMTGRLFGLEMKAVKAKSISSPVMEFLGGIGVALVIWYGGFRVINGASTVGTFFSFMTAVLLLYDPVKKLSRLNNTIQQGLAATDRVFDIIERSSEIQDPDHPADLPDASLEVSFDDVWFGYDEHMVLKGINLSVEPGEIVALVGSSGGGKTSMVNLIPRFYDVTKGAVRVGPAWTSGT